MPEIRRSSVVDEILVYIAFQLESEKRRDFTQKKANDLKTKVRVLTQQAYNKTTECISLCKQKETLASELENVKMKQHEECRATDEVGQELSSYRRLHVAKRKAMK